MQKLKNWRLSEGLSLEAAGSRFGVSGVQWHRYETGVRQVAPDRVLEIERVTGISRHLLRPDLSQIFVAPEHAKESA